MDSQKVLKKNSPQQRHKTQKSPAEILLSWYDQNGRSLPWRGLSCAHKDYKVWLSEVMLQQTTIVTGTPYYYAFLKRWPTLRDLAESSQEEVLQAWAGLGYYSRARNLHKCAQVVMSEYGGKFPPKEKDLLALPGIGPYTAAAMLAILADYPAIVVDGNVERVISRLYAIKTPLPKAKTEIKKLAGSLTPDIRPGDYAQGVMDLGATICTPRNPKCDLCPWHYMCEAYRTGTQETYPKKQKRKPKPKRYGVVFFIRNERQEILLVKRPEKGIFASMWAFPGTRWDHKTAIDKPEQKDIRLSLPIDVTIEKTGHMVHHVFTHFDLELEVWASEIKAHEAPKGYSWTTQGAVLDIGLPSVMKKVATLMI